MLNKYFKVLTKEDADKLNYRMEREKRDYQERGHLDSKENLLEESYKQELLDSNYFIGKEFSDFDREDYISDGLIISKTEEDDNVYFEVKANNKIYKYTYEEFFKQASEKYLDLYTNKSRKFLNKVSNRIGESDCFHIEKGEVIKDGFSKKNLKAIKGSLDEETFDKYLNKEAFAYKDNFPYKLLYKDNDKEIININQIVVCFSNMKLQKVFIIGESRISYNEDLDCIIFSDPDGIVKGLNKRNFKEQTFWVW